MLPGPPIVPGTGGIVELFIHDAPKGDKLGDWLERVNRDMPPVEWLKPEVARITSVTQRHIRCVVVEKYLYEKVLHIPRDSNQ